MTGHNGKLRFEYEIIIAAAPADIWRGLTDGDLTRQYVYGTRFESALKKGAAYSYVGDGSFAAVTGKILDVEAQKRLSMTWSAHWDDAVAKDPASRVTYELAAMGPSTRLRLVHDGFESETATYVGSVDSWPLMLSSLKTLLESGKPLITG